MAFAVLGLAGWSGSGKTTLLERLIPALTARGLRVAAVKHDAHGLSVDDTGKDSARLRAAGAAPVLVSGPDGEGLKALLGQIGGVDIALVEGFKNAPISRIGIARRANGKGFAAPPETYLAVVTDEPVDTKIPRFALDDIAGVAEFIMENRNDFTHFNAEGRAKMVDVGEKDVTRRTAVAAGRVLVSAETLALIKSGGMKKGDVLTVAQIAGVMGAKATPSLIPMCHPTLIDGIDLSLHLDEERCSVEIEARVSCAGRTGVEMEALTAVSAACLTVYDMCKAVQRDMVIADIRLLEKHGGVHGDFCREERV